MNTNCCTHFQENRESIPSPDVGTIGILYVERPIWPQGFEITRHDILQWSNEQMFAFREELYFYLKLCLLLLVSI